MNQRYSESLLSGTVCTYVCKYVCIYAVVSGHMPLPAVSKKPDLTNETKMMFSYHFCSHGCGSTSQKSGVQLRDIKALHMYRKQAQRIIQYTLEKISEPKSLPDHVYNDNTRFCDTAGLSSRSWHFNDCKLLPQPPWQVWSAPHRRSCFLGLLALAVFPP